MQRNREIEEKRRLDEMEKERLELQRNREIEEKRRQEEMEKERLRMEEQQHKEQEEKQRRLEQEEISRRRKGTFWIFLAGASEQGGAGGRPPPCFLRNSPIFHEISP